VKASFVMVGLWWAVFTIPLLVWGRSSVPDSADPEARVPRKPIAENLKAGLREVGRTARRVKHFKTVFLFLLAFLLYNDGVSTTIRMAVDYGLAIGFGSEHLILALLVVQFVGVPATYAYGKLFSRFSPKTGIYVAIGIYLLALLWGVFMDQIWEFYGLAMLIGLVQGGIQSLSRSFYARLIPAQKESEFFGLYNLLGRFSGIVGPLAMGLLGLATGQSRWTLASVAVFFLLGGTILIRVQEARAVEELHAAGERPVHDPD
jgi:UMF1 family MFS transporter